MRTGPFVVILIAASLSPTAAAAKIKVPADHATIQAAVDAAAAGDVIEISQGTYAENIVVNARSDLTIQAKEGHQVTVDAGNGPDPPFFINASDRIVLKSLRLENTQSQGVFIGSSTYVTIRQCALKDVAQDGIQINGSSGVLIEKCSITAPGGDGIHVHLSDGCVAVKNKIKNAGVEGIEADGDMHTFEANTIDGTGGAGILLGDGAAGCSNVLVLENKVTATFSYAIWCRPDSRDCTILGNDLIEPGSDGIYVTGGSDGHLIAKNALRDGHDLGITLESDWCSLLQNTITEPAADGIFIGTTCSGALVSKNKVTKSGGNGVGVQGTGNAFVQNKASKSAAYDLDDDTLPGDNVYINNTFPTIAP